MMKERTIARTVTLEGVGLHSGKSAMMRLLEGPPGTGIVFTRTDLPEKPWIAATVDNVINVDRCTVIGRDNVRVSTVEHFMAAVHGLGIDNLMIEMSGEEVPAMDGSAAAFCRALEEAGAKEQEQERRCLNLEAPLSVEHEGAILVALPSRELRLTCIIDFSHPLVGTQIHEVTINPLSFVPEIAPARTFGFLEEVMSLRARALALGGDFQNALVITPEGFSSPLRFDNELARHKCLDLLGDLALLGMRLPLHVLSLRGGHALNIKLAREIGRHLEKTLQSPLSLKK
jgi:UDP-3-O-acyl N-acetylglucosamine deacetylase